MEKMCLANTSKILISVAEIKEVVMPKFCIVIKIFVFGPIMTKSGQD